MCDGNVHALMADVRLVQKDEIGISRPQWVRVIRKRDFEITLLSDCLDPRRTPK
jgi:hypothetical protein